MMTDEKSPREKFSGLKFSQMRGSEIKDSTGEILGKLQDAIFMRGENGFELTKFLIGGSFIEELLEDMGLRPDVDPVFPIGVIKGVSPKGLTLNVPKEELKSTTIDEDAIEEGEFKLSDLSKFKLIDAKNDKIGNIIDVTFSRDAFQFIIGDGFVRELAEDLGLLADVDLLLEVNFIEDFSIKDQYIKLSKEKNVLKDTFEKHIPHFGNKEVETRTERYRKSMYFPRSQF